MSSPLLGSTGSLLAAAAAFGIMAADIFGPASLHLLQPLDWQVHVWVLHHLPSDVSSVLAEKWLSDAAIVVGLAAWWVACVTMVVNQPKRGIPLTAAAVAVYMFCAGGVSRGDPPLVDFLKHVFHRARPSDLHHTFSFPSGHTTAASFVVGTLVFVLAPAAIDAVVAAHGNSDATSQSRSSLQRLAVPLWVLGTSATAAGRVLGGRALGVRHIGGRLRGSGDGFAACINFMPCAAVVM